jgi:hypothetical protein
MLSVEHKALLHGLLPVRREKVAVRPDEGEHSEHL